MEVAVEEIGAGKEVAGAGEEAARVERRVEEAVGQGEAGEEVAGVERRVAET